MGALGRLFGGRFGSAPFKHAPFLSSFLRRRFCDVFLAFGKVGDHRLKIVRLPAALLEAPLLVRHIAVLKHQESALANLLEGDGDDGILMFIVKFARAPRLHDAFARNQFEISPTGDIEAVVARRGALKEMQMTYRFTLTTTIPASPKKIYEAWLDSLGHSEMTGSEANMSDQVGAEVSAWDGYISGRHAIRDVLRVMTGRSDRARMTWLPI